jgi:hypothetical protein
MRLLGVSLLVVISAVLGFGACEATDSGADPGPAQDPGVPVDPGTLVDPGGDVDAVTGATQKLLLDESHPGWPGDDWRTDDDWKGTGCFYGAPPCHTADDHNDGLDPYLCVSCHGTNGAHAQPANHADRTTCAGCHPAPAKHPAEGFPSPLSCRTCHAAP